MILTFLIMLFTFYLVLFDLFDIIQLVISMTDFNNIVITDIAKPVIVRLEKGRRAHTDNRKSFGLSLCLKGQITYTMGEKSVVSTRENAVLLPKGATYCYECDKEGIFYVVNFQCDNFCEDEIDCVPLESPQECIKAVEEIHRLFGQNDGRLDILAATYNFLGRVAASRHYEKGPTSRAVQYITDHLGDEDLSNTLVAESIGISEVYLRKLFLARYDTSPHQFILKMRINKAKELICDTQLSVADIAEQCGFASIYHFCRVFKQRVGVTPTQYGAENRLFKI